MLNAGHILDQSFPSAVSNLPQLVCGSLALVIIQLQKDITNCHHEWYLSPNEAWEICSSVPQFPSKYALGICDGYLSKYPVILPYIYEYSLGAVWTAWL